MADTNDNTDKLAAALVGVTDPNDVARILKAFETWQSGKEYATKERKRLSDQLAARIAQFNEAMAVGHQTTNDQIIKLSVVETRWQELEDARTEKKLVGGSLRDAIKSAEQKIQDLLADAKAAQLNLFAGPATDGDDTTEVEPD